MIVIDRLRTELEKLGLTSVEGVRKFQGGSLVKNHKGRRDILKISTSSGETLFLKRNWKPYRKDGLRSLLRNGRVISASRQEWNHLQALRREGFDTAAPVAMGEECGLFWERFSFLVTQAAAGETIDAFFRRCTDRTERKRVSRALAAWIRRFHDAGFSTQDLFARHVFVQAGHDSEPHFAIIDMNRLDKHPVVSDSRRARDLAALHLTTPRLAVSIRERLQFLKWYEPANRDLRHAIRRRSESMLQEARYRRYFQ